MTYLYYRSSIPAQFIPASVGALWTLADKLRLYGGGGKKALCVRVFIVCTLAGLQLKAFCMHYSKLDVVYFYLDLDKPEITFCYDAMNINLNFIWKYIAQSVW